MGCGQSKVSSSPEASRKQRQDNHNHHPQGTANNHVPAAPATGTATAGHNSNSNNKKANKANANSNPVVTLNSGSIGSAASNKKNSASSASSSHSSNGQIKAVAAGTPAAGSKPAAATATGADPVTAGGGGMKLHSPSPTHLDKDALSKDKHGKDGIEIIPPQKKPVLSQSQADFFKLLDEKIDAGQDYEPSEDGTLTGRSRKS